MGAFLASENVRWRYKIGVAKVRVSISSEPAAYTCQERLNDWLSGDFLVIVPFHPLQVQHTGLPLPKAPGVMICSAAQDAIWEQTTNDDHRDAHKPEEFLTFFIVLSSNSNGSSCELVDLFSSTRFLCLFTVSLGFFSPFETFRELHVHVRQREMPLGPWKRRTTPDFNSGGRPSNTYAGLMPFSTMRIVL